MSFPLDALTRLLVPPGTELGAVVSREGDRVRVATARGAVTVRTLDALVVGDRVLLQGGMAIRAPVARHIYPV